MRASAMSWLLALAVSAAACARPSLPARPLQRAPSAPAGVERSVGMFDSHDGVALFEQCWRPQRRKALAVVVIIHGIKDHSGRYHELGQLFARAGFAVCGFDHRGHGRSAGPRFALHSFAAVMKDIDAYLALMAERFPARPTFLFGHSMGAAMVPRYVIERQPSLAGVVVSATALRPHIHPFEIANLELAATLLPNAPLLSAPDETFSPDPVVVAAMAADPLIHHGRGTGRMALELARTIELVWAKVARIQLPILILHGAADRATNPRGSVELHRRVASSDKTLHLYPDAGHDLSHDPKRAQVFADLLAWVRRRL